MLFPGAFNLDTTLPSFSQFVTYYKYIKIYIVNIKYAYEATMQPPLTDCCQTTTYSKMLLTALLIEFYMDAVVPLWTKYYYANNKLWILDYTSHSEKRGQQTMLLLITPHDMPGQQEKIYMLKCCFTSPSLTCWITDFRQCHPSRHVSASLHP